MRLPKNIERIRFIGISGTGKTTLAYRLTRALKIKHYDLDDLFWKKRYTIRREKSEFKNRLNKICKQKKWIIEGVYSSPTKESIKKADVVIWLHFPYYLVAYRIFLRSFKRKTWKDLFSMLRWMYRFYYEDKDISFKGYERLLKGYKKKLIIVENQRQLDNAFHLLNPHNL